MKGIGPGDGVFAAGDSQQGNVGSNQRRRVVEQTVDRGRGASVLPREELSEQTDGQIFRCVLQNPTSSRPAACTIVQQGRGEPSQGSRRDLPMGRKEGKGACRAPQLGRYTLETQRRADGHHARKISGSSGRPGHAEQTTQTVSREVNPGKARVLTCRGDSSGQIPAENLIECGVRQGASMGRYGAAVPTMTKQIDGEARLCEAAGQCGAGTVSKAVTSHAERMGEEHGLSGPTWCRGYVKEGRLPTIGGRVVDPRQRRGLVGLQKAAASGRMQGAPRGRSGQPSE